MAEGKWVSYLRVSTGRQGSNGSGLETHRAAVAHRRATGVPSPRAIGNAALAEPGRHVIAGCRRKSSGSLAVAFNLYCPRKRLPPRALVRICRMLFSGCLAKARLRPLGPLGELHFSHPLMLQLEHG